MDVSGHLHLSASLPPGKDETKTIDFVRMTCFTSCKKNIPNKSCIFFEDLVKQNFRILY